MKKAYLKILSAIILASGIAWSGVLMAQDIQVKPATYVIVKDGTNLKVSGNTTIDNGGVLDVSGDVTIDGNLISTANGGVLVNSDASHDGSLIFSGGSPNATIFRYAGAMNWHQTGVPLINGTTNSDFHFNFNPSTWLMRFGESDDSWSYVIDLAEVLHFGEGFMFMPELAVTLDFEGQISSADFTLNSSTTPPLAFTDASHGFNLVGNPYSSALEFDNDGINDWTMTDMEGSIWILDQTVSQSNYRNRTLAGGGTLADGVIPMGQAFFVRATAATAELSIPAARRIHSNQAFYKNGNSGVKAYDHVMKLRVNPAESWDEIEVAFGSEATEAFDNGYDCTKLMGGEDAPQLYMMAESLINPVSINYLPEPANGIQRTVAVQFVPGTDGEQLFVADLSQMGDYTVMLEDLQENKLSRLNQNPEYVFQGNKADNPDRFRLHFFNVTGDGELLATHTGLRLYSDGQGLVLLNNTNDRSAVQVEVYSLSGKLMQQHSVSAQPVSRLPLTTSAKVVVVRASNASSVEVQKVMINK